MQMHDASSTNDIVCFRDIQLNLESPIMKPYQGPESYKQG